MFTEAQIIIGLWGSIWLILISVIGWLMELDEWGEWFLNVFISFFISMLCMGGMCELDTKDGDSYYTRYCTIHSLRNQESISGSFSLGCGSVEQTEYYYYYYKDSNGYFLRGKKRVDKTVIEEKDGVDPHLERIITEQKSRTGLVKWGDIETEWYKIVVPKGTVINKFEAY